MIMFKVDSDDGLSLELDNGTVGILRRREISVWWGTDYSEVISTETNLNPLKTKHTQERW